MEKKEEQNCALCLRRQRHADKARRGEEVKAGTRQIVLCGYAQKVFKRRRYTAPRSCCAFPASRPFRLKTPQTARVPAEKVPCQSHEETLRQRVMWRSIASPHCASEYWRHARKASRQPVALLRMQRGTTVTESPLFASNATIQRPNVQVSSPEKRRGPFCEDEICQY